MADRRQRAQQAGVADQDVQLAVALVQRRAQTVQAVEVAQVVGRQHGLLATGGADLVVQFLQAAHGTRDEHELRALGGETLGDRGADAARGAGNNGNAAFQLAGRVGHQASISFCIC